MYKHLPYLLIPSLFTIASALQSRAKYEPDSGCYIGAFVLNDLNVRGSIVTFESLVGKKHAGYLTYSDVSSDFPQAVADSCREFNAFLQIGFEPNGGLDKVNDDPHLRTWAKAAAKSGIPVFLRFASEMNGAWVAWHGDPTLYKTKWKIVYNVMKEEAPNVVMVWAPSWAPNDPTDSASSIMAYYPGDDCVDWVGVDFYMWGPVFDLQNGESGIGPLQKIKTIYDMFPNKPIMICEWAAAAREYRGTPPLPHNTSDYCISHMQALYSSLRSEFPRVKAVFWFDYDSHAINCSDFSITGDSSVLRAYRSAISPSYFLSDVNYNVPRVIIPFQVLHGTDSLSSSIFCTRQITDATLIINGKNLVTIYHAPWIFPVDVRPLSDGEVAVEISVHTVDGYEGRGYGTIEVDNNGDFTLSIIDNDSSGFMGAGGWVSSSQPDCYGGSYYVLPPGKGFARWRWTPRRTQTIGVYAMWSAHSNRTRSARYVIHYDSQDSAVVVVNQQINGGVWNWLGNYPVMENSLVRVDLLASSDGYTIADAIRFYWNTTTGIREALISGCGDLFLRNYPNPFNTSTKIKYSVPFNAYVTLRIYDILGREVADVVDNFQRAGEYEIPFDANNLSTGIYLYKLQVKDLTKFGKMLVLK